MTKKKILVIDKDPAWISAVTAILEKVGYSVSSTYKKSEAFSISLDVNPDLSIFEVSGDGFFHIDLAKELYERHDIPFIVVSDSEETEMINKAALSGALSYLIKPIREGQLLAVVESALQRANDIRRLQNVEQSLSTAIQTARVISAAIGIMMERFRLTNNMAFEILRTQARSNQKKIVDMASEIVSAAETVNQFNFKNNISNK